MTNLNQSIDERQPISISTIAKKEKNLLMALAIIVLVVHISFLIVFRGNIILSCLLALSGITMLIILNNFIKKYAALTIKGEHLIFNSYSGKTSVTPIRSIKKLSTLRFMDKKFVKLQYFLDGKKYNVIIFSNVSAIREPEQILTEALNHIKNKRQIYKPGSVSVN